jgi:hypothetical protein
MLRSPPPPLSQLECVVVDCTFGQRRNVVIPRPKFYNCISVSSIAFRFSGAGESEAIVLGCCWYPSRARCKPQTPNNILIATPLDP